MIYKLELPTINLTTAFSQFDIANDNFIAKGDFRKVLREFGIQIGALDFEDFLSRWVITMIFFSIVVQCYYQLVGISNIKL